jgi:hypothetical protein
MGKTIVSADWHSGNAPPSMAFTMVSAVPATEYRGYHTKSLQTFLGIADDCAEIGLISAGADSLPIADPAGLGRQAGDRHDNLGRRELS